MFSPCKNKETQKSKGHPAKKRKLYLLLLLLLRRHIRWQILYNVSDQQKKTNQTDCRVTTIKRTFAHIRQSNNVLDALGGLSQSDGNHLYNQRTVESNYLIFFTQYSFYSFLQHKSIHTRLFKTVHVAKRYSVYALADSVFMFFVVPSLLRKVAAPKRNCRRQGCQSSFYVCPVIIFAGAVIFPPHGLSSETIGGGWRNAPLTRMDLRPTKMSFPWLVQKNEIKEGEMPKTR